ncbi:acylphosphatase [Rhodopila sp.]|jgi:acylphosphatase|uniref:acylphosphatase n=1 Tax=Rhodopila sp. TaxID=2480087 RepID=UPI002D03DFCC|nr:acylphosphatase [Rhodopila sp.]HVZ10435.1 acylphosphatase [Rhodopila sp.]
MIAKLLLIQGRVQCVGYRDWMVAQAGTLGLSGWVRNKADDMVEALIFGDVDAVEEMARLCRRGPKLAEVVSIVEEIVNAPAETGFYRRASI